MGLPWTKIGSQESFFLLEFDSAQKAEDWIQSQILPLTIKFGYFAEGKHIFGVLTSERIEIKKVKGKENG